MFQVTEFLSAGARQWGFLVRGLQQVEPKLQALNIPFYMMYGNAEDNLPKLCDDLEAGLLICDYVPVHAAQAWRTNVSCQRKALCDNLLMASDQTLSGLVNLSAPSLLHIEGSKHRTAHTLSRKLGND